MTFWTFSNDPNLSSVVLDAPQATAIHMRRNGVHAPSFRATLNGPANAGNRLRLLEDDEYVEREDIALDVLGWEWTVMVSDRAKALMRSLGVDEGTFFTCRVEGSSAAFHLVLPQTNLDVVDVRASQFRTVIPVDPPIYSYLTQLAFKPEVDRGALPPLFMGQMPGYLQAIPNLIVTAAFKSAWEAAGLVGALFTALD